MQTILPLDSMGTVKRAGIGAMAASKGKYSMSILLRGNRNCRGVKQEAGSLSDASARWAVIECLGSRVTMVGFSPP